MTNTTQVLYRLPDSQTVLSHSVDASYSRVDALAIAERELAAGARIIRAVHPLGGSYGNDVVRFNRDHAYPNCKMGRYPGSDVTECDTHGAYVVHGVPAILR
jgi:hypothetical protein